MPAGAGVDTVLMVPEQQANPNPTVNTALGMCGLVVLEVFVILLTFRPTGTGAPVVIAAVGGAAAATIGLAARSRSKGVVIGVGITAFLAVPVVLLVMLGIAMSSDPS
jgi:hypothetical protein